MKRPALPDKPSIHRLRATDTRYLDAMLDLFAAAFDDHDNYSSARPGSDYRQALLNRDDIVMLVALKDQEVVGAIVAYQLRKFEQERSEYYNYDLAVASEWRRLGIATALISATKAIAKENNGSVVFVQADYGDDPAIALYTKLGDREDVMHFDIPLED